MILSKRQKLKRFFCSHNYTVVRKKNCYGMTLYECSKCEKTQWKENEKFKESK